MTYCFPAVLCSRFSFRLSVRQVVSRVILRGSALHYFAQRPIWAHGVDGHLVEHVLTVGQSLDDILIGVLQTKVNRKNEKSPAKFTRPKMGITKQAGEKSHRQPG